MPLEIGSSAPHFNLQSDEDKAISLNDFKGQKVLLYFYPKDNTPGCTQEACDFKDNISAFNKLNVAVIGVSRDSVKSHQKFKEKYQLNFPLLADTEEEACKAYDVLKEKNMYGKKVIGIERSTFLIDENGKIAQIWRKVNVKEHLNEVLEALQ